MKIGFEQYDRLRTKGACALLGQNRVQCHLSPPTLRSCLAHNFTNRYVTCFDFFKKKKPSRIEPVEPVEPVDGVLTTFFSSTPLTEAAKVSNEEKWRKVWMLATGCWLQLDKTARSENVKTSKTSVIFNCRRL